MASFSGLGIGLSLAFGCLVLALVGEVYYLLWWKKRVINAEEEGAEEKEEETKYAKELFHLICWKKPHSSSQRNLNQEAQFEEQDLELGASKDLLIKAFNGDESIESELMRLHNLSGPPRFLFTIKEETKEDLESEDAKSRDGRSSRKGSRTTSLGDLIFAVDSPLLKSPNLDSYQHHGFNPLFESSMDSEIYRVRSSPPPKFKFLRDAEEKLLRKLMEEAEKKGSRNCINPGEDSHSTAEHKPITMVTAETEGSFLGFIVGKTKEKGDNFFNQLPATSSQVLPLASSPTALRPLDKKPNNNVNVH